MPASHTDIVQAFRAKWDELVKLARERYNVDLSRVDHKFNITSTRLYGAAGRKAGRYYCRWHPKVMSLNLQEYLNVTVPHEAAHIVCYMNPGLGGHGHNSVWRSICIALGGTGSTRVARTDAALPVMVAELMQKRERRAVRAPSQRPVYLYRTASGKEHMISAVRHSKILRGMRYRDTRTKEPIGREQFVRSEQIINNS